MISTNTVYKKIEITDVTSNGDGIAKIEGYPLFVRGAVTGDIADIEVTKTNKNYGFARLLTLRTPSVHRVSPVCPSFLKCGGCDLMHIDYGYQKELKAKFVTENMRKIGGFSLSDYTFDGIIGADGCLAYRNKAQFPVAKINGKVTCGFYSKKSHNIVPCNTCDIQHPDINAAVRLILDYANEANLSVYDEKSHSGTLRHIYVRRGNGTGHLMAVLVTNSKKKLPHEEILIKKLTSLKCVTSIIQNINTDKTNLILGDSCRTVWGEDAIISCIGDLKFKISPHSFFQVNGAQTEKLYNKALEYADVKKDDTVFDLYCGAGTITLFLARSAKNAVGVEIVKAAVENAKENAELNGITNAEFYDGDSAEIVEKLLKDGKKADVVTVDPPRKGCTAGLLELIRTMRPNRLVYVSCNSATLARDAKILKSYGFKLKSLCAADMFPQTSHVECVVLMSKVEK